MRANAAPHLTDYLKKELAAPLAMLKRRMTGNPNAPWAERVQATMEGARYV